MRKANRYPKESRLKVSSVVVVVKSRSGPAIRLVAFDAAFHELIAPDAQVETLAEGGDLGMVPAGHFDYGASLESPLWWREEDCLLVSDIPQDRILRWSAKKGIDVYRQPSGHTNGLWRDPQGRLLMCEHSTRQVTRLETDGSLTVVMRSYRGRRLNRPNSVVVRSDGTIYWTDLRFRVDPLEDWDVDFEGVYMVSPDLATRTLLLRNLEAPHKLLFSPDERVLYIGQRQGILAFDVQADDSNFGPARLNPASRRWFWRAGEHGSVAPDGIKMDVRGNFYIGGRGGIWAISAEGRLLGHLDTGGLSTPNLCFGGRDGCDLLFVSNRGIYRVPVTVPGVPIPKSAGTP